MSTAVAAPAESTLSDYFKLQGFFFEDINSFKEGFCSVFPAKRPPAFFVLKLQFGLQKKNEKYHHLASQDQEVLNEK